MKALVSITCVAILSFVGYYFFNEYRSYTDEKILADKQQKIAIEKALKVSEILKDKTLDMFECDRMARLTIPDKAGVPALTTEYFDQLEYCAARGRLSEYSAHQLKLLKAMLQPSDVKTY